MENASKALIIAGAILISIVLIGVGVLIVGNAQGIFGNASGELNRMEIESYNSKFVAYEGSRKGSDVRTLIGTIFSHNVTNQDDDSRQIKFALGTGDGEIINNSNVSSQKSAVKLGKTYTITFDYDSSTGLITTVHATEGTASSSSGGSSGSGS